MSELTIGIIGLDTSHVIDFTELFNNRNSANHVAGGKVVAAYPAGSPDFQLSYSRVGGYTKGLKEQYGVNILPSAEAVAEQVDAILLESVDGRVHLSQFEKVAPFGKPVFIDKPFAVTYADARKIVELASQHGVPLMSCSALRYSPSLTAALENGQDGTLIGIDCFGPMELQATQPGLFWYGIHCAEMLFAALGVHCIEVKTTRTEKHDLIVGQWQDGRIGTIRGNRLGNPQFGAVVHREKASRYVDCRAGEKPFYVCLVEQIMAFFKSRRAPIDLVETLQIIRFIEAANSSRDSGHAQLIPAFQ